MNTDDTVLFNTLMGDRSEKADQLHRIFLEMRVDFATGVPCGVLRYIIRNFDDDKAVLHVLANRENVWFWCIYTIPLEPTLSKIPEKIHLLRPAASRRKQRSAS